MAHIQKKCRSCRVSVAEGNAACRQCGARRFAYVARYRSPDHRSDRARSRGRSTRNFIRVSIKSIYQWRYQRVGPRAHRVGRHGRHLRYRWEDVEAWLVIDAGGRTA
jgi:hypothetical protein